MNELPELITKKYKQLFDKQPLIVRSPGRVNLIGEHTDYNQGFVLPAAIDRAIIMAINLRQDDKINIFALDKNESFSSDIESYEKSKMGWPNYILGVIEEFRKKRIGLKGFNCVFGGDIPIGAGLSSSAALEGAVSTAMNHLLNVGLEKLDLVKIGQAAEHNFVGVRCGIMDQYINIFGERGGVLRIDCRTNEYQRFPFRSDDYKIVLCDSGIRHDLVSSEYNVRRSQCETGIEILQNYKRSILSLRDVSHYMLDKHQSEMGDLIYKRCAYVIRENVRVLNACKDLEKNDLVSFGNRMFESHYGLSNEYEVSCKELDYLVDTASNIPGVLGSRMMGAGFGGCTINLVTADAIDDFKVKIQEKFSEKTGNKPQLYISSIENGAEILE